MAAGARVPVVADSADVAAMSFEFSPEQRRVYDLVGDLGRTKFAPRAAEHDVQATTPSLNMEEFHRAGLLGLTISEDLGGMGSGVMGTDPLLYLLAVEQTARYDLSTAQCLHIHCHGAHLVDQICGLATRTEVLGQVLERGALLNATGSEPGRTSRGLYKLVTEAKRVDGGYVLNGMKNYATLAEVVGYHVIFAGIAGEPPSEGHVGFVIPDATPGISVVPGSWNPMGMRGAVSPNVLLEDCFVADRYVLGTPGTYPRERWQAKFHLGFAAQYLGATEGIFDYLKEYLPKRGTTGDAYAQLRMGEIRIGIDSVRWLIYRAAWLWQRREIVDAELFSMVAKHRAIENAVMTMDKAAQIAGSSAFGADLPLSRLFRDLRVHTLHENLDKTAATIGRFHLGEAFDTTARL